MEHSIVFLAKFYISGEILVIIPLSEHSEHCHAFFSGLLTKS